MNNSFITIRFFAFRRRVVAQWKAQVNGKNYRQKFEYNVVPYSVVVYSEENLLENEHKTR